MGAPQAVVGDDFGERGDTGEPEKRGYTGPGQGRGKRGSSARRRQKGSDISMLLRGEEPTVSGFFGGVKEKEVSCLRCDKPFMSRSRENRICQPCRGGTEDLMRGSLPAMGAGVSAQNNELGGGASPRSRAGGVKRKKGA